MFWRNIHLFKLSHRYRQSNDKPPKLPTKCFAHDKPQSCQPGDLPHAVLARVSSLQTKNTHMPHRDLPDDKGYKAETWTGHREFQIDDQTVKFEIDISKLKMCNQKVFFD
jgi:hypothetical protein